MRKASPGPRFGIVASRFNEEITDALLANCLARLREAGVPPARVRVVRVPGGFEIPWAAQKLAASRRFDAVICLGAVLRGQTPQNDYMSRSLFSHLHAISLSTGTPCILGVITPDTWKQAQARTRGELDRGREAADAALEMAALRQELG
ncbi:MAG: 6,7-dimethyl-8-ribityllumazine synthase [Elusimicrobia bacterium]|nr:6,7-dimethyl-8-ribityllumazine synthase [Elusimicrobiota bacterium]